MQDPTAFAAVAATLHQHPPQFPEQEQLRCPRCDSTNTKFCYYNNYNLSQPRHFCKSCRRYWTKGGALRNIPVGGSTRKSSKRSSPVANDDFSAAKRPFFDAAGSIPSHSGRSSDIKTDPEPIGALGLQLPLPAGGFSSLLAASDGQLGSLLEGIGQGTGGGLGQSLVDGGCDWGLSGGGGGGWPDLAIFTTPSSRLQ